MIKHWQFMENCLCFLHNSKIYFDPSERKRFHSKLWEPLQKLQLFDTDKAINFLLPFYSHTDRPAKNQPQFLRSLILFFLMLSMGLTPPYALDKKLLNDHVLAALIGCPPHVLFRYLALTLTSWTSSGSVPTPVSIPSRSSFRLSGISKSLTGQKTNTSNHRNPLKRSPKGSLTTF